MLLLLLYQAWKVPVRNDDQQSMFFMADDDQQMVCDTEIQIRNERNVTLELGLSC